MLGAMFSGRHDVPLDDDGYVFIDRDGTHFRTILNLLRTGVLDVPESPKAANELTRELQYYQLDTCVKAGAISTTDSRFELIETFHQQKFRCQGDADDYVKQFNSASDNADSGLSHARAVQAKLSANPSLKVVNSYAVLDKTDVYATCGLHIFTALAA